MSMVPVTGFNGHPVLMYGSSKPVAMNTPCFSQLEPVVTYVGGVTYSINRSTSQCTLDVRTTGINGSMSVEFKVRAVDRYTSSFYASVSYTPPANKIEASVIAMVDVSQVASVVQIEDPVLNHPNSDYVSIPYYRYRIRVLLNVFGTAGGQGRVSISL